MRNVKVTAEKYKRYLDMTYREFCRATLIKSPRDQGFYDYCVFEKDDTAEARLKYIDYLINEKYLALL